MRRIKTEFRCSLHPETISSLIGVHLNSTYQCCEHLLMSGSFYMTSYIEKKTPCTTLKWLLQSLQNPNLFPLELVMMPVGKFHEFRNLPPPEGHFRFASGTLHELAIIISSGGYSFQLMHNCVIETSIA